MHVCVCVRPIIASGKFTPSVRQYLIGCQLPANGLQSASATRWPSSPLALSISSVCLFFKLGVCLTPLWLLWYGWKMAFHAWNEVSFKSQSSVKFYFMDLTPTVNTSSKNNLKYKILLVIKGLIYLVICSIVHKEASVCSNDKRTRLCWSHTDSPSLIHIKLSNLMQTHINPEGILAHVCFCATPCNLQYLTASITFQFVASMQGSFPTFLSNNLLNHIWLNTTNKTVKNHDF